MKRQAAIVLLAVSLVRGAAAHRLDEYLQATLIGITRDRVDLEINLTPGVAVLPVVVAAMDRNADGWISPEEQQAYAGQVLRDVTLQVDGRPAPLRLVGSQFPPMQAMKEGLGSIRLNLRADRAGRELRFENRHMRAVSVYLVNCLASPDRALTVGPPQRDEAQRSIRFAYSFADAPGNRPAWWLLAVGILATARLAWLRFS